MKTRGRSFHALLLAAGVAAFARPAAGQIAGVPTATSSPADSVALDVLPPPAPAATLVDLNRAPLSALLALPFPPGVARAIADHRTYQSWFTSVFDLLEVPGMTPEAFARVKTLVSVTPAFEATKLETAEEERRAEERNYVVQRLLSEEGASEGLVDQYVDQIRDPKNVNRLDFFALLSYQNVSPIDAVAVLEEGRQSGRIENTRQLRAAPGISYWGFRNLRDFIRYDDPPAAVARLHGDYQFRIYDTPYVLDDEEILVENIIGDTNGLTANQKQNFRNFDLNTFAGRLNLGAGRPNLTNKLRLRWGRHWRAAALTHRNLGEEHWAETAKGFVSYEDATPVATPLGTFRLYDAVLGNYAVSLGQGLVMDATDFYLARRGGYGYSIRSEGLRGDLSRNDEYTLRGGGLEAGLGRVRGTFFYSQDDKDAILNPDGSFRAYIRMVPRLDDDVLAGIRRDIADGLFAGRGDTAAFLPMRDVMRERLTGANLKFELAPGTYAGLTGVEMRYGNRVFDTPTSDRWNPDPNALVIDPGRIEDRDAELGRGYNSLALGNYRRVWGAEAQATFRNVSLAGEYGKLETSTRSSALKRIFDGGPEAKVAQAYVQYENLTFLSLYRDYDPGYDNPYNRGFSENSRYQQTILDGSPYRLKDPYWAELATATPQPKSERGWYFTTRYQFTRQLTLSGLEFDTWKRRADGADLKRVTLRAEYRPIFPLRLRLRHRVSSRHGDRSSDVRAYTSWDSRLELLANLSEFDQLRFLYSTTNVTFSARGRLSAPATGGDVSSDSTATRGIPERALQAAVTHNFNPSLAAELSTEIYDGFLYNFEDNEFMVTDGRGYRNWFLLRSRLSGNLSWRFKWTSDHQLARTYEDIRSFGQLVLPTPDATNVRRDRAFYRFQLDLSF